MDPDDREDFEDLPAADKRNESTPAGTLGTPANVDFR
jgi:hypothetical protein